MGLHGELPNLLLTGPLEVFLCAFAGQPISQIALAERLDRQCVGTDRVLGPVVVVISPVH